MRALKSFHRHSRWCVINLLIFIKPSVIEWYLRGHNQWQVLICALRKSRENGEKKEERKNTPGDCWLATEGGNSGGLNLSVRVDGPERTLGGSLGEISALQDTHYYPPALTEHENEKKNETCHGIREISAEWLSTVWGYYGRCRGPKR